MTITVVRQQLTKRGNPKRGSKRYRIVRSKSRIPRGTNSIFPVKKTVTLHYFASFYYNGSSGGVDGIQLKLNSIYSPEGTLTTYSRVFTNAQPYYTDQIAPMYDNYCVTKCRVKVCGSVANNHPTGATYVTDAPYIMTLRDCDDNSTVPTDTQLEVMRPNCAYKIGNASNPIVLSKTFDLAKMAGMSKVKYLANKDNWGTSVSLADPYDLYYANAQMRKLGQESMFNPQISIELWQTVVFFGTTQVSKS